jgi:hypothetical protein
MENKIWKRILAVVASGLAILALSWLLLQIFGKPKVISIVPVAEAIDSLGKGDVPIATSSTVFSVSYWLALQSSTYNSWSYPDFLTGEPRKILPDLILCESGGNTAALNECDKDKTASYGLLEFKPHTLWTEAIHYGLIPTSTPESAFRVKGNPKLQSVEQRNKELIYNAQLQVLVASHMIMDNWKDEKFWLQQFPGCFKIYRKKWKL